MQDFAFEFLFVTYYHLIFCVGKRNSLMQISTRITLICLTVRQKCRNVQTIFELYLNETYVYLGTTHVINGDSYKIVLE